MKAQAHHRGTIKREIRAAKHGSARDAIGTLRRGHEVYILTFGQFSLIDALMAILEQTGPADVTISTWTAADAHLEKSARLLEGAAIKSLRFIVDRSFLTRQPDYCTKMRRLFGDECIRTARTHAKFMTIVNNDWKVAVRTSMNLNENPRLENIEISDDAELCGFLNRIADEVFGEQPAGTFDGGIPSLDGIDNIDRPGTVAVGSVSGVGRMSVSRDS